MTAAVPVLGDWFWVADTVSGLTRKRKPGASHPLLIKSSEHEGPRLVLLPRSTSRGLKEQRGEKPPRALKEHAAHNDSCGSSSCKIDKKGFIQSEEVSSVDRSDLDCFSCHEPNEEVINWATSLPSSTPGNTRRDKQ